jgi:DNA-binding beta-propeller fold protein YncE
MYGRRQPALMLVMLLALAGCGGGSGARATQPAKPTPPSTGARTEAVRLHLVATHRLADPVQLPALATARGRIFAAGGLDAADTSVSGIVRVGPGRARRAGTLPLPVHDAAAAALGGSVYVFGGGTASGGSDQVTEWTPGATARVVSRLPAPSSDLEAATVGGTAYVVGGFTGTTPLRSVLAFRPGRPLRDVAALPHPLRYAAVAPVGGRVLIAGGTDGATSRADVLSFDPATRRVHRVGRLPQPLSHAAAASLGGTLFVFGGRAAAPNRAILAVDPQTGAVHRAGRLPAALSDASAVAMGGRIWVVGGRDAAGQVQREVWEFAPGGAPAHTDVYAADRPGRLAPAVRGDPARVYVPNSESGTVDVVSQRTGRIVDHFAVGRQPQHVTPSWDLRTLWVTNDLSNSLTPIDPRTGRHGRPVPVLDPYNLYFTADGKRAIVVAEAHRELDFRSPHTMRLRHALHVPQCAGVDHMDYTASGRQALVSCEFAGRAIVVDLVHERVLRTVPLKPGAMPQDVKLSPDGRTFYVADMASGGVWLVDARTWHVIRFQPTGAGAHGLYPSRDSRSLYVSNRGEGSVSVLSFRTRRPVRKWRIPGGGSPDMGGVSADGRLLWLTGRYNAELYAIDTRTGRLVHRVHVGLQPHGACVWPQPGRYSIGHTGILR